MQADEVAGTAAYVNVRHRLAEVIEREYGLADPANEGYRPEAFTLAGALLNALCADRATPPLPHPTILLRAVLLCSDSTPESVVQCDADGTCPVHKDGACALWFVPWADAHRASVEYAERFADAREALDRGC